MVITSSFPSMLVPSMLQRLPIASLSLSCKK
jgi:hypothetical protein